MRFKEFSQMDEGKADVFKNLWGLAKGGSKAAPKAGSSVKAAGSLNPLLRAGKFVVSSASKLTAKTVVGALKGNGLILKSIVGAPFLMDVYSQYAELESQYNSYLSGDTNTEIFKDASHNEAKNIFATSKMKIIGEAMLVIGPMLTKTDVIWKFFGGFAGGAGKAVGALAGGAAGSTLGLGGALAGAGIGKTIVGTIARAPFSVAAFASKLISGGISGPLFILFVGSDAGQKFFHEVMKDSITLFLGSATQFTFTISEVALNYIKSFFTDEGDKITAALGGTATSDTLSQPSTANTTQPANATQPAATANTAPLPPEKQQLVDFYKGHNFDVTFDKNNPNIMRITGHAVTDKDGYLRIDDEMVRHYLQYFTDGPNPFANIPKRPGQYY